jgi:hypothetical protein
VTISISHLEWEDTVAIANTCWERRGDLLVLVKTNRKHGGHRKILAIILPDRTVVGRYQAMLPGVAEVIEQDTDVSTLKNKVENLLLGSKK